MIANKYFDPTEFDSPDQAGSGAEMMQPIFIDKLTFAREMAGIPFKINSGYRTIEHNSAVGGSTTSSHLRGYAADIACTRNEDRALILESLWAAGFSRIGIGRTFIHVDCDPDKYIHRVWIY